MHKTHALDRADKIELIRWQGDELQLALLQRPRQHKSEYIQPSPSNTQMLLYRVCITCKPAGSPLASRAQPILFPPGTREEKKKTAGGRGEEEGGEFALAKPIDNLSLARVAAQRLSLISSKRPPFSSGAKGHPNTGGQCTAPPR